MSKSKNQNKRSKEQAFRNKKKSCVFRGQNTWASVGVAGFACNRSISGAAFLAIVHGWRGDREGPRAEASPA